MSGEKHEKSEMAWWKQWLIFFGGGGFVFGVCMSLDFQSAWGLVKGGLLGAVGFLALAFFLSKVESWWKV